MTSLIRWLVSASLLVACTSTPRRTQLIVTIDADPEIAADTRRLDLEIRGGLGDDLVLRHEQTLRGDQVRWPLVVALAPLEGDTSRILVIEARARDERDTSIGRVRARTGFAPGSARMLALRLDEPCRFVHRACEAEQTCRDGGCQSADVDAQMLPEYSGPSMAGDAGVPYDASGAPDATESLDASESRDATTDPDAGLPDAMEPMADPLDCGDCFYVIDSLRIPDEGPPGVVIGVDLDGRVSDENDDETCGQPDFRSPELVPGIDNQLAVLKPSLESFLGSLNDHYAASLRSGDPIMLIEMVGVRSTSDREVVVNLYNGRIQDGGSMALRDGRPAPGQTFDVAGEHVGTSGALLTTMSGTTRGRLLEAGPITHQVGLDLPSTFPSGPGANVRLRNIVLRAYMDFDGRLSGVIGGTFSVAEVAVAMGASAGFDEATAHSVLQGVADLDRDPATGRCRSFSAGFTFTAVRAIKGHPQP